MTTSEGTLSAQRILGQHTPGPIRDGKAHHAIVSDNPAPGIRGSDDVEAYGGHLIAESVSAPNRRRIIACWNACEGSTTDWLEAQWSPEAIELFGPPTPLEVRFKEGLQGMHRALTQRDLLLAALQATYDALCISYPLHSSDMDKRAAIMEQAQAAIASVTGQRPE